MKELDRILEFLRSSDGVNQLQRAIPAQNPHSIRVDERQQTDIINFLKELSGQIQFFNRHNQQQGNWSPFFDNLDQASSIYAKAASNANLPAIYENGIGGVDASLKGLTNDLLPDQDGIKLVSGDLLLVWKQNNPVENGVYILTQGNTSMPFVLTRAYQASHSTDFNRQIVEISGGILHSRRLFVQEGNSPVIGSSDIVYHRGAQSRDDWPPHQALLLTFLHLFGYLQQDINQLTARHLSYYYERVLQIQKKKAAPDKVHTIFELNKNAAPVLLPSGTLLDAGKTPDGKLKRTYALDNEIYVNHASVQTLKSSYTEVSASGKKIIFKAEDTTEIKTDSKPGFRPFGMGQLNLTPETKNMTEAKIGFAIASPNFLLSEGERKLIVTLNLQASPSAPPPHAYEISVTGANGWIYPSFSVKDNSSSKLVFEVDIPTSSDPLVAYDELLHGPGFVTSFPIFRCQILPYSFQMESLATFTIGSVNIQVEALGVSDLILQNDQAVQDPGNPALPFGNQPLLQSNFYIGSSEVFKKSVKSISLNLEWQDPPENFADYYRSYFEAEVEGFGNNIFTTDLYLLAGRKWLTRLLFAQSLFNPGGNALIRKFEVVPAVMTDKLNNSGYKRNPEMETFTEYTGDLSTGFIKLVLTGPTRANLGNLPSYAPFEAFGHKSFTKVYTKQAIALSQFTPPGTPPALPNEPYTPTLKSVSLDYTAGDSFDPSNPNGVEQFFSLDIFGILELGKYGTARIIPKVPSNGALYIGIKNAAPPQLLSFLFQISDGSAPGDTLLRSQDLKWSYMTQDQWKPIAAGDIVEESTGGLQQSGIIRLNLGANATLYNIGTNLNQHWLRLLVDEHADGSGNLEAIHLQATSSTLVHQDIEERSFIEHLNRPLPPNSISKLVNKISGIKKINQPYGSVKGIAPETDRAYYQRVSERLRHRNKTVIPWDYERMVLEKFPQVFKVKCLSHSDPNNGLVPGHIKLVIVPDFRKLVGGEPLQPKCNASLLREISDSIVQNSSSPFVSLMASNPAYETLLVDSKVSFREGFDPGYYSAKLEEEIKQFLSAWAYDEGKDITFGGKIYRNELLAFVEGRHYVDYVVDFKVYHRYKGQSIEGISKMAVSEDFIVNLTPKPTIGVAEAKIGGDFIVGQPVEVAKASRADSILVSNSTHRIRAIQNDDFLCSGHKKMGIGQMIVKVNFIIQ